MKLFKSLANLKKDATKKANDAADKLKKFVQKPGNPIPWVLNPNYKQINKPTTSGTRPAPKKKSMFDRLGDNIRSVGRSIDKNVTQPIAKEVKHIVKPVAGEVALRAKQVAANPNIKKLSDKLGDGLREFDKKVVQPTGDYIGDVARGDKNILGNNMNREAKSKMPQNTDTNLVDTSGMTPEQKIAYDKFLAQQKLNSSITDSRWRQDSMDRMRMASDNKFDQQFQRDIDSGRANPILNIPQGEAVVDRIRNTLAGLYPGRTVASGGSGILALPPYPEDDTPSPFDPTTKMVASGGAALGARSQEYPDTDDVMPTGTPGPNDTKPGTIGLPATQTATSLTGDTPEKLYADFYTQYKDVASPLDLITYKSAAESGDTKKMEEILNKIRSKA